MISDSGGAISHTNRTYSFTLNKGSDQLYLKLYSGEYTTKTYTYSKYHEGGYNNNSQSWSIPTITTIDGKKCLLLTINATVSVTARTPAGSSAGYGTIAVVVNDKQICSTNATGPNSNSSSGIYEMLGSSFSDSNITVKASSGGQINATCNATITAKYIVLS